MKKIPPFLICLITGILCGLPLIFDRLFWLSWIAFIPMFRLFLTETPRYRDGFAFGLGYYGLLYHWFSYLYPMDFAGLNHAESLAAVAVCWIGLALLQTTGTAFIGPLFRLIRGRHRWMWPISLAAVWTFLEWCQTLTWMGVPYCRLALSQCAFLPMIQSASLLGSLFIGFLLALVNGCLALALLLWQEHSPRKKIALPALTAAALVLANGLFGVLSLAAYQDEGSPIRAAAIQGNISSTDKWASGSAANALTQYTALSRQAADGESPPRLILWPETALTVNVRTNKPFVKSLSQTAKDCGAIIITGAFDRTSDPSTGETHLHNALVVMDDSGVLSSDVYYKRRLVPFGEFLPMADVIGTLLPILTEMNLVSDDLTPGSTPSLIETEYGSIGGLICFDSIYETLTLDTVRAGAELLVLSTNDSWYQDSAGVYQHNKHAMLRAVESGRYIVRAANTGISSIIRPTGEVVASLAPLVEGYLVQDVYFRDNTTVYTVTGNLIVWLSMGWMVLAGAEQLRKASKKQ